MTKTELFLELAKPDAKGYSRWVYVAEFKGRYSSLVLNNGGSWCRASSSLQKKYIVEFDKSKTIGNSIDAIRLVGYKLETQFNQYIRKDIRDYYKTQNCVMLGINGQSINTKIEIDHKNGRKDDLLVSSSKSQKIEDFQPLCKAANDVKRQICKRCKETSIRWDAKNIKGNPYSFYRGDCTYTNELGCIGCYQYDPVEYRKESLKRIIKEATYHTSEYIFNKLFGEEKE